jgi:hypothetical protein
VTEKLKMILYKRRGKFELAACRGMNKGCNVAEKQRQKLGPCEDCILCDDHEETMGELLDRINRLG